MDPDVRIDLETLNFYRSNLTFVRNSKFLGSFSFRRTSFTEGQDDVSYLGGRIGVEERLHALDVWKKNF